MKVKLQRIPPNSNKFFGKVKSLLLKISSLKAHRSFSSGVLKLEKIVQTIISYALITSITAMQLNDL